MNISVPTGSSTPAGPTPNDASPILLPDLPRLPCAGREHRWNKKAPDCSEGFFPFEKLLVILPGFEPGRCLCRDAEHSAGGCRAEAIPAGKKGGSVGSSTQRVPLPPVASQRLREQRGNTGGGN